MRSILTVWVLFTAQACVGEPTGGSPDRLPGASRGVGASTDIPAGRAMADRSSATELVGDQDDPVALVHAGAHLYWLNRGHRDALGNELPGALMKLPLETGEPALVADGLWNPRALASDGGHLYWVESDGIKRVALGDGVVEHLVSTEAYVDQIAVNATRLYWYQNADGPSTILSSAKDGTDIRVVDEWDDFYLAVAASDDEIYWTTSQPLIIGASVAVPDQRQERAAGRFADRLVVAGGLLFLAENAGDAARIAVLDPTDNEITHVAAAEGGINPTVAPAGQEVFFSYQLGLERYVLARAPLLPGSPTIVAESRQAIRAITVTDDDVYWALSPGASERGGSIHRAPR